MFKIGMIDHGLFTIKNMMIYLFKKCVVPIDEWMKFMHLA